MATTNKKVHFSYFERKQDFTTALQAELTNNIVFVEDTKEVYTHGEFFGIRGVTLNYDSSTAKLQLKDGSVVVSEMDASAFVKDGMLDSVELIKTQESGVSETVPYLKFVFNTDAGKSAVRLSVSDLVDSYDGSSIALTQSFAPASSYSAPAAGDSVDVAVGKLLKGHSDNVTALSQKQATITGAATTVTMNDLTPDRALASSGSGKIAVSTTTATELGYVHGVTSGIQAQIDAVSALAAKGLKQVDLATYQGTDGEIVQHIGATSGNYVHGYIYKYAQNTIPAGTVYYDIDEDSELAKVGIAPGRYYRIQGSDEVSEHFIMHCAYSGKNYYPSKGYNTPFVGQYAIYNGEILTVTSYDSQTITLENGTTFTKYGSAIGSESYENVNYVNIFESADGARVYLREGYSGINPYFYDEESNAYRTIGFYYNSSTMRIRTVVEPVELSSWQRIDVQPQTDISGKQDALTFDDAPTVGSNNVVKSGGVDTAIKNSQRVFYAVTETAGATAVKEFTIPNFPTELVNGVKTPLKGTILIAQCANTDTRTAQLKFKVNDGGEFPIWYSTAEKTNTTVDLAIFGNTYRRYAYAFNGTHWCWVSNGDDVNTTYTAGSGLKLSSNQFSLNVPRVAKTANSLPGVNTAAIEEYTIGANYNLPTNNFYHILTFEGSDNSVATQLALGVGASAAYYREYYNSTWKPWLRLDNPSVDSTPTASSTNPVQSGGTKTYVDEQVATKSSITIRQWVTE